MQAGGAKLMGSNAISYHLLRVYYGQLSWTKFFRTLPDILLRSLMIYAGLRGYITQVSDRICNGPSTVLVLDSNQSN